MTDNVQKEVFSAKLFPETIRKIRRISQITGLKVHAVVKNAVDEYEKNPNLPAVEPEPDSDKTSSA
ncbi:MAG: hypothetical protein FWD71_17035 [Oscillospiraceae bacterium]|nr:hypothetical protein [Oscillospiraceae bacterium]